MHWKPRPRSIALLVSLAVATIGLASCGDDDGSTAVPDTDTTTTAPTNPTTSNGPASSDTATSSAPATSDAQTSTTMAHAGQGATDADGHDHDSAAEVDTALARLVIADGDEPRVVVIDLDDTGEQVSLDLPAVASVSSALTDDGRFLLTGHDDSVTVVDGGTWSDEHGTHAHHFTGEPQVLGTVAGDSPTHLISHDGTTALWFDGLGEAVLLDEDELAHGHIEEVARVPAASPHHGFAVPYDDQFVMTALGEDDEELPGTVVVAGAHGAIESEHSCSQVHGEASWAHGVAAACGDGVLVLDHADGQWTSTLIPYPEVDDTDPYGYGAARAWVLVPTADGEGLVAPLGARHLLVIDPHTGDARAVDMGADVAIFGVAPHEPSGAVIVLTGDGAVQLVDPDTGDTVDRVAVLDPFTEADPEQPYRMLVPSGESVFVSDPDASTVVELTTAGGLAETRRLDLGFVPVFLEVFNG